MTMNKKKATMPTAAGGGEGGIRMTMGKKTPVGGAGGGEGCSHMTTAGKKKATEPAVATGGGGEVDMFAAMSRDELVKMWEGIIDEDREAAAELFWEALARAAAAEYKREEDRHAHPHAHFFEPWQPSSSPEYSPPPPQTAFNAGTVLALCAPPHLAAGETKRTPSTAQGEKPGREEIAHHAGEEEEEGQYPHARSFLQPREPSTKPDQAPRPRPRPQTSSKTVMLLCAPPHLARERKGPPSSTTCARQGKKRRVV